MKKIFIVLISLLMYINIFCVIEEIGHVADFIYGNSNQFAYDNWVSHIAEGVASEGYNYYADWDRQTNGFGDFLIATDSTLALWEDVIDAFIDEEYEIAQNRIELANFPYQVVHFIDTEIGQEFYALRELPSMELYDDNGTANTSDDEIGAFLFGWGLFIYNPNANQPIVITAPHPNDDFITPPIAYQAFLSLDAMFYMVNGAGREVKWTEIGNYTNSKSLSDPSRNANHPFQKMYEKSCNKIRTLFGVREFSAQIHSYDWNRHLGYPNCQISAGYGRSCPNLPIRDLSNLNLDMILFSDPIIHPENTVGEHSPVFLNEYYGVYYDTYEFMYESADTTFAVNDHIDLPGYSQNRQMLYSTTGWNHYDVVEPFLHLEMDELPSCYEHSEENLKWFYGFNEETGLYDMDQLYTRSFQFYTYWIDRLSEALPYMFEMNDGETPLPPNSFQIQQQNYYSLKFEWSSVSAYDFKTFEILYSEDPLDNGNYQIFNRYNYTLLASPFTTAATLTNLSPNTTYHVAIRSVDYAGNFSELSDELIVSTAPAQITQKTAYGLDEIIYLNWFVQNQSGNEGFLVYRENEDGEFDLIDSWQSNPELIGSNISQWYHWSDADVQNGTNYTYLLGYENEMGNIYYEQTYFSAQPENIFCITASGNELSDSTYFGMNQYATNVQDDFYDVIDNDDPENVLRSAFYQNWDEENVYVERQIDEYFIPSETYHSFPYRIRSAQIDSVTISISTDFLDDYDKLFLRNTTNNEYHNLVVGDYTFEPGNEEIHEFDLFWGNLNPSIMLMNNPNQILQNGDTLSISWQSFHNPLIAHYEIYILNEVDTILLQNNIAPSETVYEYVVNTTEEMHGMKVLLKLIASDGYTRDYFSNYRFSMIPDNQEIEISSGSQLISNPWIEQIWQASELFTEGSSLFSFDRVAQSFEEEELFDFANGYWLDNAEDIVINHTGMIQNDPLEMEIQQGWNLISNPHIYQYDISSLRFYFDNASLSYLTAVQTGKIDPNCYQYVNGEYKIVHEIDPFTSFFLYVHDSAESKKILFNPYFLGQDLPEIDNEWDILINVEQNASDSDSFIFSSNELADEHFQARMDTPEPPLKPISNAISAYLIKDISSDSTFSFGRLNRETRQLFDSSSDFTEVWDFALHINTLTAINLSTMFNQLPSTYAVSIELGDFEEEIVSNEVYVFEPTVLGEIAGRIIIQNFPVSTEITQLPVVMDTNFPNPFNPSTTIQFYLSEQAEIQLDIYNVKGQHVKKLHSGILDSGKHYFTWNGKNESNKMVASGVYFYRLHHPQKVLINKMILVK